MDTNTKGMQLLTPVEEESSESQVFWCEPVDLADEEGSGSRGRSFDDGPQCGCGCTCSCSCS